MSPENARVHVHAEIRRADESLRAARALLDLGLLNDAVSRAYYAALHVALTASTRRDTRCSRQMAGLPGES